MHKIIQTPAPSIPELKSHWVADLYPLNESDVDALAEDIKRNGQILPIKALHDGRIIDGRNRWLACQKSGVEPIIEIINPDGQDVDEDKLFELATSCNAMRRDLNTSLRACLAAEAWKRINPDETRGGNTKAKAKVKKLTFEEFSKSSFKVNHAYAKQALAILNAGYADIFDHAKTSLSEAYDQYKQRKLKEDQESQNKRRLQQEEHGDLREQVEAGKLRLADAVAVMDKREAEKVEQQKAEANSLKLRAARIIFFLDIVASDPDLDAKKTAEAMAIKSEDNNARETIKLCSENAAETINQAIQFLEAISKHI